MSVITDYVVADEHDAKLLLEGGYPYGGRPFLDLKGVEQCELCELFDAINGKPSPDELVDEFTMLAEKDEAWVNRVPDHVRDAIASLDHSRLQEVGERWVNTTPPPAIPAEHWRASRAGLLEILPDFVRLADVSRELCKPLLLVVSL